MSIPPFLDLPDGVRARRLATPRGELAALTAEATDAAERPTAVFVPGFTGSKEDFIAVLAPLAEAGFDVAAIDLRGQFESAGDDDPTSYELKALAEDVLAVIGSLGGTPTNPMHLVGHSFGGLVCRTVALAAPGTLRSLVLLDSGPAAFPQPAASNLALLVQALPVMDMESIWVAKRQIEMQQGMPLLPVEIEDFIHRRFLTSHPVALLRQAEQLLGEPDRVQELAATGVPILVAYGEDDDGWPPAVQAEMADRLGVEAVSIPGAVHSPAAENPSATVAVLTRFWESIG